MYVHSIRLLWLLLFFQPLLCLEWPNREWNRINSATEYDTRRLNENLSIIGHARQCRAACSHWKSADLFASFICFYYTNRSFLCVTTRMSFNFSVLRGNIYIITWSFRFLPSMIMENHNGHRHYYYHYHYYYYIIISKESRTVRHRYVFFHSLYFWFLDFSILLCTAQDALSVLFFLLLLLFLLYCHVMMAFAELPHHRSNSLERNTA